MFEKKFKILPNGLDETYSTLIALMNMAIEEKTIIGDIGVEKGYVNSVFFSFGEFSVDIELHRKEQLVIIRLFDDEESDKLDDIELGKSYWKKLDITKIFEYIKEI